MKDWIETTQIAQTGTNKVLIRKKDIEMLISEGDYCNAYIAGYCVHINMPFDELSKEILPQLGRPKNER